MACQSIGIEMDGSIELDGSIKLVDSSITQVGSNELDDRVELADSDGLLWMNDSIELT